MPQSWPTPAVRGVTLAPGPPAKPVNPWVVSDTLVSAPITHLTEKWDCAAHGVDHRREARVLPLEPFAPGAGVRAVPRDASVAGSEARGAACGIAAVRSVGTATYIAPVRRPPTARLALVTA